MGTDYSKASAASVIERTDILSDNDYQVVIRPNQSWFHIDWQDMAHYSDLLWLLVRRDFVARYKQTVLGPAWFVIQPLLTTIVFTVIFGRIAGISTDGAPPMLFYLCGLLPWNYFAQCLNATSTTFVSNADLFGKVYFPRLVLPLSAVISNLIAFAIQFLTFLAFYAYFKWLTPAGHDIRANLLLLLLLPLLLQTAALGLGVGLWMSALTAKYRDFSHLTVFMTQLWMYATPIIYPLSEIPQRWRWLAVLNPMTGIVETYKAAFLGSGVVNPGYLAVSAAMTLLLLFSGVLIFNRTERTFMDTV